MNKVRKNTRKGSALVLVFAALAILLFWSIGFFALSQNSRLMATRDTSTIVARTAADAGLSRAVYELNVELKQLQNHPINIWSTPEGIPLANAVLLENCDNATYYYDKAQFVTSPDPSAGFKITSYGKYNGAKSTTQGTVRLHTIWDYALWVQQTMILKNGSSVNWVNASPLDLLRGFKIGTDSTAKQSVTLNQGVKINADLVVGVGGNPDAILQLGANQSADDVVSGDVYPAVQKYQWNVVTAPTGLPNNGSLKTGTTITSSRQYSSIDVASSLQIGTPTNPVHVTLYVTGDMVLKNGADVTINQGSSLTLYLGGSLISQNSNGINNLTLDSRALQIYGLPPTCKNCQQKIDLKSAGNFYGAIYAPNAAVTDYGGSGSSYAFYGALAAKSFVQNNSGTFNYDCNLRRLSPYEKGVFFAIETWKEDNSWQF